MTTRSVNRTRSASDADREDGPLITFPEDDTFGIGSDTRTGVALLEYRFDVPFKSTGRISKRTFNLGPDQLTAEERERMHKTIAQARGWRRGRNKQSGRAPPPRCFR